MKTVRLKTRTSPPRKRKPVLARAMLQIGSQADQAKYVLGLYVSRSTLRSKAAVENVTRVCEQHLKGRYDLEVVDIYQQANLARDAQIVAVPTLIKRLPLPLQRLVGDMSDLSKVLVGLDLRIREQ